MNQRIEYNLIKIQDKKHQKLSHVSIREVGFEDDKIVFISSKEPLNPLLLNCPIMEKDDEDYVSEFFIEKIDKQIKLLNILRDHLVSKNEIINYDEWIKKEMTTNPKFTLDSFCVYEQELELKTVWDTDYMQG